MSMLLGIPIEGRVGPESFTPHLDSAQINQDLVVEWKSYLTDCLQNNFAVSATINVSNNGGTVLWIPAEEWPKIGDPLTATVRQDLLQEFARQCLHDFIQRRTRGN